MPRDGSNIYHRPPGTDGVPNYTVESARYNAFTADIEQDLNLPRPVIAGGTGANNAADAMTNLGGELSAQLIVNYNSDPFQAGSFYSAAGATGAPTVNAFTGICYAATITGSVTTDLFIEARDQITTTLYVRQKKANVWGSWLVPAGVASGPTVPTGVSPNSLWWDPTRGKLFIYYQDADSSQWVEAVAVPDVDVNTFVEIAGDNMTGPLILSADPTLPLGAATKQYVDNGIANEAVRYDVQQTLTDAQKAQASTNIGIFPGKNLYRNGAFDIWQRGANPVLPGAGASYYTADGWMVSSAGAAATIARQPSIKPNPLTQYMMTITGIAGNTDVTLNQRIESLIAARAGGRNVTVQGWVYNNTGVTLTPTLLVQRTTAPDNYAGLATELAATPLQPCPNGVFTQVSYTFALSAAGGVNGFQTTFDFGAVTAARSVAFTEYDLQVTPGVPTGLNAHPPVPEFRFIQAELALCQRYFYFIPAASYQFPCPTTGGYGISQRYDFKQTMRVPPTMSTTYSGTSNFTSNVSLSVTTDFTTERITGSAAGNTSWTYGGSASAEL